MSGSASTFDDCLTGQTARRPGATAVVFGREHVSYEELERRVNGMAVQLRAAAVGPGERVLLVADNSADHLAAAFAVWRASAVLVTIYPSSTLAEIRSAVERTEPAVVIADTRVRSLAAGAADRAILAELDGSGALAGLALGDSSRGVALDPDGLALVCFTSGSTARPKAVVHTHRGLLGAATAYARVWHLGPDDTTLVCLPMAWAFGLVTTSMAALVGGGRVVALARAEPGTMLEAMVDHGVTFFAGVTTMFVKLVQALDSGAHQPDLGRLRLCISGGEPRNEQVFARWRELSGCPVHDVYAASECFPVVTYDPLEDPEPRTGRAGRVVAGAALRVVDRAGVDVPLGTVGQAWTRGPAQFQGYWGDPELTAEALTPDGWYRTSDLVRLDEGYVQVVGRASTMIIRGGINISPAEVEAVLSRHPTVREAAVVGVPDVRYGEEVVAAVVLQPSTALDPDALRRHCANELAAYKVPSRYVAVAELPRSQHTGKLHRTDLMSSLRATTAAEVRG